MACDTLECNCRIEITERLAYSCGPRFRNVLTGLRSKVKERFLSDPIAALRHFTKIDEGSNDPIVLARPRLLRLPGSSTR
jgi:hypothetical protein